MKDMTVNVLEFQPGAVLHDAIVAALHAQGRQFQHVCEQLGISVNRGRQATLGMSRGPVGMADLRRLIEQAGPDLVRQIVIRRMSEDLAVLKKGAA
jgi:hypothetical protein